MLVRISRVFRTYARYSSSHSGQAVRVLSDLHLFNFTLSQKCFAHQHTFSVTFFEDEIVSSHRLANKSRSVFVQSDGRTPLM